MEEHIYQSVAARPDDIPKSKIDPNVYNPDAGISGNSIARWYDNNSTRLQESPLLVDDAGNLTGIAKASMTALQVGTTATAGHVLTADAAGNGTYQAAPVTSVAGKAGAVTLAKADVGLGSVDNTADSAKPVSTAQQTALDAKLDKAGGTLTGALTLSGDPTAELHAATKQYVDALKQGLDLKDSVRAATTASIANLSNASVTIDGVTLVAGDRVLVKDGASTDGVAAVSAANNGIYVVGTVTTGTAPFTRAADADSSPEVTTGMYAFVSEGTANADSGWVLTTNDTITLGTTNLVFTQFSGAGQITAGIALAKTGNTLDVELGTTAGTAAEGNHSHTLDNLSDVVITTPASDQVLKFDGTNWVNGAASGGGSGQAVYTHVVAASGGTHTTLGAALAAATAGDSILVREGTYVEAAISSALANITIVGESLAAIIDMGANEFTMSGARTTVTNLKFQSTTGAINFSGEAWVEKCFVQHTGTTGKVLTLTGASSRLSNCFFESGVTAAATQFNFGQHAIIENNHFVIRSDMTGAEGVMHFQSSHITFANNNVNSYGGDGKIIGSGSFGGSFSNITGNIFRCAGGLPTAVYLQHADGHAVISSNTMLATGKGIEIAGGPGYSISGNLINAETFGIYNGGGGLCVIAANRIKLTAASGSGIGLVCRSNTVTGNFIAGFSITGTGSGIIIYDNQDNNVLTGNRCFENPTGITISGAGNDTTVVSGNNLQDNTTPISDAGTGTVVTGNVGINDKGRTATIASAASHAPNINTTEVYAITAQAAAATIAAPTGTPANGQKLTIRIKDNATAWGLTWDAIYRAIGATLPTTTVASKTTYVGCIYNALDAKWDVVSVAQEA